MVEKFLESYEDKEQDTMYQILKSHPKIIEDPRIWKTNQLTLMYTSFKQKNEQLSTALYLAVNDSEIPDKQKTLERFNTLDQIFK